MVHYMKKIAGLLSSVPFLLVLSFLCAAVPLAAETSVVRTAHFDIIYPPESAETARLLATYADGFADEISLLFDSPMKERIPVYVNPDQKDLNAYFTSYLYNRIVVYDALPVDGALSGSRDVILKVFYHELVHLVSLNVRTPFWQLMAEIFGDFVSVNDAITMPMSFLEGATVSLESRDGEGRLNDPLVLHSLRQAKIDHDFPTFKDAAGARDTYPGGRMAYYFGGGFSEWLQKTYGMEKYAELWKRGGGFNPFLSWTWTRFHQVYGLPIETAWAHFRDSIELPADLREEGTPVPGAGKGIITAFDSGAAGIVWADANAGKVFLRDPQGKTRALFDSDGYLTRLSLSGDGTLLLVSSFSLAERSTGETVRVFDLARGRFTGVTYRNLRDAAFAGDTETVCGVETKGQRSSLVVFSRGDSHGASGVSGGARKILAVAGPGMAQDVVFSPVFAGNGKIAFLGSHGRVRDIVFVDTETGALSKLFLPAGTDFVRQLGVADTANGRVVSFCWAAKADMYRYGFYDIASGELTLQNENVSGGVFMPVPDQKGSGLYYISSHVSGDRLMHAAFSDTDSDVSRPGFGAIPAPAVFAAPATQGESISPAVSVPLSAPVRYNPVSWFRRGVFFPFFGTMPREDGSYIFAPSLTYLTEDPTESVQLAVTAAFFADPLFVEGSVDALLRTDDARVNILAKDQVMPAISQYEPYRQVTSTLTLARTDWLGASWKKIDTTLSGTAHWYAPDAESRASVYDSPFDSGSVGGEAQIVFSALHSRSVPGRFLFPVTVTGYSISADGYFGAVRPDPVTTNLVQGKLSWSAPVIPVRLTLAAASADGLYFTPAATLYTAACVREYVWDETQYYPLFPEYKGTVHAGVESDLLVAGTAEITPFLLEIQKGVPFLPLYANRLSFVTGYRAAVFGIADASRIYLDSVYARGSFEASAVIGILTNVLLFADVEYACPLRSGSNYLFFTFGAKIPI